MYTLGAWATRLWSLRGPREPSWTRSASAWAGAPGGPDFEERVVEMLTAAAPLRTQRRRLRACLDLQRRRGG
eukprot:145162-Lingulodinium_polyedra.AAC.1